MPNPRYDQLTWYRVDDATDCWLWTAYINLRGYGAFHHLNKQRLAHRHFYEHFVGPIPDGLVVDHICFVRHCVNPAHLQLLTMPENSKRQRSALLNHCTNGHEYDAANTYRSPDGRRVCRQCSAARGRAYRARKRQAATTTSAEFAARIAGAA